MDDVGLNNKRHEKWLHSKLVQLKFDKKNDVYVTIQDKYHKAHGTAKTETEI